MGPFVRTLMIWMLVLAVPAQGMAAVLMALCGPGHHGGVNAVAAHHGTHAERQPHGHAAASVRHRGAEAQPVRKVSATAVAASPAKFVRAGKHKCSACAACCSAAALPNMVLTVPAPDVAETLFNAVVPRVGPFVAGGPDRPPRTLLA